MAKISYRSTLMVTILLQGIVIINEWQSSTFAFPLVEDCKCALMIENGYLGIALFQDSTFILTGIATTHGEWKQVNDTTLMLESKRLTENRDGGGIIDPTGVKIFLNQDLLYYNADRTFFWEGPDTTLELQLNKAELPLFLEKKSAIDQLFEGPSIEEQLEETDSY